MTHQPNSQNQKRDKGWGKWRKKKGTRKGVGTSGSHNASMRAILRICCPIRQDVRTQERATLVRPGDSRRGLSQRERCSVGREEYAYRKHHGHLSYYLQGGVLAWVSSPATDL